MHASRKTPGKVGVCVLGWPSNSPDLNVIENCWYVLSQNIYMNGAANNLANFRGKVKSAIATFKTRKIQGLTFITHSEHELWNALKAVWFRIYSNMCHFKCHFATMPLIHILWLLEFYFSKSSNCINFVKYNMKYIT